MLHQDEKLHQQLMKVSDVLRRSDKTVFKRDEKFSGCEELDVFPNVANALCEHQNRHLDILHFIL